MSIHGEGRHSRDTHTAVSKALSLGMNVCKCYCSWTLVVSSPLELEFHVDVPDVGSGIRTQGPCKGSECL